MGGDGLEDLRADKPQSIETQPQLNEETKKLWVPAKFTINKVHPIDSQSKLG